MSCQTELIERYQTLQGQEIHVGPWLDPAIGGDAQIR